MKITLKMSIDRLRDKKEANFIIPLALPYKQFVTTSQNKFHQAYIPIESTKIDTYHNNFSNKNCNGNLSSW